MSLNSLAEPSDSVWNSTVVGIGRCWKEFEDSPWLLLTRLTMLLCCLWLGGYPIILKHLSLGCPRDCNMHRVDDCWPSCCQISNFESLEQHMQIATLWEFSHYLPLAAFLLESPERKHIECREMDPWWESDHESDCNFHWGRAELSTHTQNESDLRVVEHHHNDSDI